VIPPILARLILNQTKGKGGELMEKLINLSQFRENRDKNIDISNYQEALNFCNLLIAHFKNNLTFDDWFKKGLCHFKLNQNEDAINNYNKALKLDATNCQILVNKAICLLRIDAKDEAFQIFRSVLSSNPNIGPAWFNIGYYYMEHSDHVKGAYEKGVSAFRRAVKLIPEIANAKVFIPMLDAYGTVGYLLNFATYDLDDEQILDTN
jgi:tetratricopeptide (TPR) repeat protein